MKLECDLDGNCLSVVREDFINLMESPSVFIELTEEQIEKIKELQGQLLNETHPVEDLMTSLATKIKKSEVELGMVVGILEVLKQDIIINGKLISVDGKMLDKTEHEPLPENDENLTTIVTEEYEIVNPDAVGKITDSGI